MIYPHTQERTIKIICAHDKSNVSDLIWSLVGQMDEIKVKIIFSTCKSLFSLGVFITLSLYCSHSDRERERERLCGDGCLVIFKVELSKTKERSSDGFERFTIPKYI